MSSDRSAPSQNRETQDQSDCGFTLVELLVSMALLSLISTLLAVSLRTGRTALINAGRINETVQIAASQGYLREALAQARSLPHSPGQQRAFDLNLAQVIWRPPLIDAVPQPLVIRSTQLLSNVVNVSFAYYGDQDDNGSIGWHASWSHPVKLPRLVAVEVTFAPGDPRRWDRLVLPIHASEAAAIDCPPRGRCR